MGDAYRVLVTGSRNYTDRGRVWAALDRVRLAQRGRQVVVVHGDCSRGPDRFAQQWTDSHSGVRAEPHPADWERDRKAAGFLRNAAMVAAGADECAAFIAPCDKPRCDRPRPHGSHGASDCADRAERAGIPTWRYTP